MAVAVGLAFLVAGVSELGAVQVGDAVAREAFREALLRESVFAGQRVQPHVHKSGDASTGEFSGHLVECEAFVADADDAGCLSFACVDSPTARWTDRRELADVA